jgi:uncharacterized OB-fold protein
MEERSFSDISYEQFLNEEKLMGCQCKQCQELYLPPRPLCIKCHNAEMSWVKMSGKGKLSAFTCIAIGPSFMIAEGFNRNNPYCTGVVELEEGVRVDARIEGIDPKKPDDIKVGMHLKVKYLHRQDQPNIKTYLAFEPLNEPNS